MPNEDTVIGLIAGAFASTEPPPSDSLVNMGRVDESVAAGTSQLAEGEQYVDEDFLYMRLKGGRPWQDIPPQEAERMAQMGAFSFLKRRALIYYLPAFLIATIRLGDDVDILLYCWEPAFTEQGEEWEMANAALGRDLSSQQRRAVAAGLRLLFSRWPSHPEFLQIAGRLELSP